ncbi:flagellar motor switch protein FliN [bacterium]|nr:flagellar motor switch protein FliN [bacterium]
MLDDKFDINDDSNNELNQSFDTDSLGFKSEPDEAQDPVTVQPVQFASFDASSQTSGEENQNLDLLMDIKLQLTVELGRCELPIKKVLELTRGSIVELDKVAGEPVALYANGKHVANGEVVVIEDNFGLRITNISDPEERMKGIQ